MTSAPGNAIAMDHVALASRYAWDHVIRYSYHLGAQWLGGPSVEDGGGFYFCQVEMEGGTKLEFLEPIEGPGSDFLRRFLHRNGPGPHHFTFKVSDFDEALEAVGEAGYDVVGVERSDPDWQEAFLHPKQSHGIVIQLAHHGGEESGWPIDTELPPARRSEPPTLQAVEHLVADLDAAAKLFSGPLRMEEKERFETPAGRSALMTSGPWRLVLIEPTKPEWQHWLGTRTGRLLQLVLAVDEPGTIDDAIAAGDGSYLVPPEHNLGTRLSLHPKRPNT